MKVFIAGGTGFIGPHLIRAFNKAGFEVTALIRRREKAVLLPKGTNLVFGDPLAPGSWQEECNKASVVVNLVGANIFSSWTKDYKRLIRESRVKATHNIVSSLCEGAVLLNASAVGFYGANRGEEEITEESPPGCDFLAQVCQEWEAAALSGSQRGARVCIMRLGVVLGKDGGALAKMLPPFRLGLGGPVGSGRQWFPWIHIEDLTRAVLFLAQREDLSGPFNFVAPQPVRNKEFVETLAKILKRPAVFKVPSFMLKILLGERADLLLGSIKAKPKRLLDAGFSFNFPRLESALRNILTSCSLSKH